MEEKVLL